MSDKAKGVKARIWLPIGPNGPGGPEARFDREDVRNVGGGTGPTGLTIPYFVWSGASPTATEYLAPGFDLGATSTANPLIGSIVVPKDGTVSFATLKDLQESGNPDGTVTLYLNGVATAIQIALGALSLGYYNAMTLAVSRGDNLQAYVDANNKPLLQFSLMYV